MADDFDLGPATAPPLAMSPMGQPAQKDKKKQWLRLAMVMAAAAKGGPGAVEGVLQGIQRSDLLGQQQQNQQANQARLAQQDADVAANRQSVIADRELQRKQDFLTRFQGGLKDLDDEAAMQAYVQLHQGQAGAFGVDPAALGTYAATAMPANKLQKKAAESYVGKLKATYGDKWLEQAAQFGTHTVKGEQLTLEEVLRRAELPGVPQPVAPTPKANPVSAGSFEEYVNLPPDQQALRRQQRKEFMQADDRPPAPPSQAATETRTNARIDRIGASFNSHPIVKEFNEVQAQHGIIKDIVNGQWSGPGDMAAVFAFMKALDPNSVVRETEYANAAKSGNIFAGWAARFNGAVNPNGGFLSDRLRRDFLRIIESRLSTKTKQYQNLRKQLVSRVDRIRSGAPETGDEAILDYESAMPNESAAPPVNRPAIKSMKRVK